MNRRQTIAAIAGLLLVLAGPFAYMATMRQAFLRSSGVVAFAMMAAGLLMGLTAARRGRRRWPRVLVGVDALLLAAWTYAFWGFARLPAAGVGELTHAPDFTLPDHAGRPVRLSAELARGPVMLVFYRGDW